MEEFCGSENLKKERYLFLFFSIKINCKKLTKQASTTSHATKKYIYIEEGLNVNHFLVVNVRTAESAPCGGDQSINRGPPFNSMPSHESRLVIRRGPNVAPSHPPPVALSAVLMFTTKKLFTFEPDPIYIYILLNKKQFHTYVHFSQTKHK